MPGGGGDEDGFKDVYINVEDGLHLSSCCTTTAAEENERRKGGGIRVRELVTELAAALGGNGDLMKELESLHLEDDDGDDDGDDEEHHFPTIVIAAGLAPIFFSDEPLKRKFESLFSLFAEHESTSPSFHYFPSFKRVRVSYQTPASAIIARVKMDGTWLDNENHLKCFFGANPIVGKSSKKCEDGLLHPPTPDKQFLISPPASPPVGWEPHPEYAPTINFDLLSALSKLSPGETCELFKSESKEHPSIFVHIADTDDDDQNQNTGTGTESEVISSQQIKPKIMQTKRPSIPSTS